MPRYAQLEIDDIREIAKRTVTTELNTREGTLRRTILRYMNDADETLQGRLIADIPDLAYFDVSTEIDLVAGQRDYSLPSTVFGGGILQLVEWSRTGDSKDYAPILGVERLNVYAGQGSSGFEVTNFAGSLRVSPVPDTALGKFRVTYPGAVDAIDVRRGKINAVDNDGTDYTTITLYDDDWLDLAGFVDQDYICVVAADGSMVRRNMQFASINASTRVITLAGGQAMSGGAITFGQYVVVGQNTRSQSQLPRNCDRYRIHYAALAVQMQTSNSDALMQDPKLQSIYDDIELSFRKLVRGPRRAPLINSLFR